VREACQYVLIVLSSLTAILAVAVLLVSDSAEPAFTLLASSAFTAVSAGLLELTGLRS
jgi:hypothetical protein